MQEPKALSGEILTLASAIAPATPAVAPERRLGRSLTGQEQGTGFSKKKLLFPGATTAGRYHGLRNSTTSSTSCAVKTASISQHIAFGSEAGNARAARASSDRLALSAGTLVQQPNMTMQHKR